MINEMEQQRLRLERRREALGRLAADVALMARQPPATVAWTRTRTDLVEMVHLAWGTHRITDPYGRPCTQRWLARRVFEAAGLQLPRSLTHVVWKINNRTTDHRSVLRAYL